jgi:peptidoglycan hydrolase CwlO-like protein
MAQMDSLKAQIETIAGSSDSDQPNIARYDAMVARYNLQLNSWKDDLMSHQARIDAYNQKVEARNNYLVTHCRRSQ